jgi:hypothetical protein
MDERSEVENPETQKLAEPEPSLSESFQVQIRGWENENGEEATEFGQGIMGFARELSCHLDLSRLASIVIAWDYSDGLASIDVGDGMPPVSRTENEYGEGGAMSVAIKKDEELWNTVVIWTPLVRKIMDVDDTDHKLALQTFVHELIHVEDQRLFDRTYPGGWKNAAPRDERDDAMQRIVNACQSEYSAQRRSAHIAPETGLGLLDMLSDAMRDVDEQIISERRAYRLHGDVGRFWAVACERLSFLFQAIGYGLGHSDYIASAADKHPELAEEYAARLDAISEHSKGWLIDECRLAVQPFFQLEEWTDMSIYDALEEILEKLLNQDGVFTSLKKGQLYLDMPYSSLAEL